MPNFGFETIGGLYTIIDNYICGSVFTISESGTAESITVALDWTTSAWTGKLKCAIYKHSDLNLVGSTEERTIALTSTLTWYTFNFTGTKPSLTASTEYILVVWAEDVLGICNIGYSAGDTNQCHYQSIAYTGTFPNPMVPLHTTLKCAIYCTYSVPVNYFRTVTELFGGLESISNKYKGAVHLSTEILGGLDIVSSILGLTVVVTDEDLSIHTGYEWDEVTYTATVLDSHGNPLPSNFVVSLEYKEIETILVLNQPLDDSVYNQVTGLLILIWHVPAGDTDSYTVILKWNTQENIWLNGWLYRRFHQINPATGAGTNYQKRLVALYNSGCWKNIRFANEVATIPPPSGFQFISGQTATYWDGTLLHVWFGASSDGTSDHDCIFYTNSGVPFTTWATPVKVIDNRDIDLGMRDPTSIKVGTTLYIFIQTYDTAVGKGNAIDLFKIINVDSADLTNPDSYIWVDAIIELGAGGAFDDTMVASPCAMESGGTYYLVYEAMKNDGTYSIGLAHSANCESWTKDGQLLDINDNPIVNPTSTSQGIVPCVFNSPTKLYVHIARAGGGKITLRAITGDFVNNEVELESYELDPQIDGYWNHNALSETTIDAVDFRDRTVYLLGAWSGATYYLRVYVDYDCFSCETNCETDFDDIRFTDWDGQTLLDYWLEQKVDSDYAIFWVEITDSLESVPSDMYCYFGNSTVSSISDITTPSLWGLGDDFNDNSRDAKWTAGAVNATLKTFGHTQMEEGFTYITSSAEYVYTDGSPFQILDDGIALSITVALVSDTTGTNHVKCAIYRESDSVLIGVTEELNISLTEEVKAWYTFNFSSPPNLVKNETYVLVTWAKWEGAQIATILLEGVGTELFQSHSYNSFPNPADFDSNTHTICIYCTYQKIDTSNINEINQELEISALANGDEAWYVTTASKDMSGCVIRLKIRNNQNLGQMGLWVIPTKYTYNDLYAQSEWYRVLVYGDGNLYIQSKTGGTLYSGVFLGQTDIIIIKIVNGHIYFYEQNSIYPWLIYLRADEEYSLSSTTAYIYLEGRCDNGAKLGPEVHEDFFSRKMIATEPTQGEWGDVESQG